ncbi:hypothetical protein Pyn_37626 [Prunus yedoensis var. nudiflora]|uniref:Uncharacterized protein n=1 Tax=Prunus yedoensis var. nudiflora TaxID=2094558 RepID=A0A314UA34_PRUYE|nr:hypothetical protein Pyn_37626 [Prunus yedoensis var. nudiflora]
MVQLNLDCCAAHVQAALCQNLSLSLSHHATPLCSSSLSLSSNAAVTQQNQRSHSLLASSNHSFHLFIWFPEFCFYFLQIQVIDGNTWIC